METRPTMTLNELTCDLRKCGVKTSPTKVKGHDSARQIFRICKFLRNG